MPYIGGNNSVTSIGFVRDPSTTQTRESFTATASQTTFTTTGYTNGFIDVYLNGIHLVGNGVDFTASNGTDVVLTTGAATDDVLDVVMYAAFDVANVQDAGFYRGNNGNKGNAANGREDIIRVHSQSLTRNVTIAGTENAICSGPLTIASGVTLTVTTGGNLSIV